MAEVETQTQPKLEPLAIVAQVAAALGVTLDGAVFLPRPIEPTAVYDEDATTAVTGTSYETRYRAVRAGKLTCRRIGARRLYLGSDLLNWIAGRKEDKK